MRHAPTAATRAAAFPRDEPIAASAELAPLAGLVRVGRDEVLVGPALRCRQTAAGAGLPARTDARLAGCDYGAWAGLTSEELAVGDPESFAAWRADPHAAPHGGESLAAFASRVSAWLEEQASGSGRTLAITDADFVKAAVVHALGDPPDAFWRLDVATLGVTELHVDGGRWTVVQANCPAVAHARQTAF